MQNKILQNTGLFLLALVFSIGLMFAFTELPQLIDRLLQTQIGTPHSDPAYDAMRIELFYDAYAIRLIGFICLGLILFFIILGFATRKTNLAWIGSVALFLPVFATFAHSMFYLAGLGLFNIIFFPLQDISLSLIDLGKVVLIPYWILMWVFGLFDWYAHNFIAYLFMVSGAFIFVLGVFAWMQTRYSKDKVAKHWIYKYSRHPQYLGWIVWSYGLMLFGPTLNQMKKSWGWYGTLPWLLSTLVIIGICLLEEIKMKEIAGEDYEEYRNRTPFLLPMPRFMKWIIKSPMRLIFRKDRLEKRKEIGLALTLYAIIFMALSLFWIDLSLNEEGSILTSKPYNQNTADSTVAEIRKPQPRRYRDIKPFGELLSMGNQTHPVLMKLIEDPDPEVREFAIMAAYQYGIKEAIPFLITAIHDPELSVSKSAIRGLGELGAVEAIDTLFYFLENPIEGVSQDFILARLSKLGCTRIIPYLEQRLQDDVWYRHTGALRSMMQVDFEMAKMHIYQSLEDERPEVRREAVNMLLETLPDDAVPYLEKVIHDKNWEVRFYARQAIRMIEDNQEQKINN